MTVPDPAGTDAQAPAADHVARDVHALDTAAPPDPVAFDLSGPLPQGTTVLEASAGTGKTYTIAALAARYVAEGTPLDRVAIVTFTRNATGELRERVRERIVRTERALRLVCAGGAAPGDDEVTTLLAAGDVDVVRRHQEHLDRAIAGFDGATIATTHAFCADLLSGLGVAGEPVRDLQVVDTLGERVAQSVDDLYVLRTLNAGPPEMTHADAQRIGRTATDHPTAIIDPPESEAQGEALERRRLAAAVRTTAERRARADGVATHDDVVGRLARLLADERRGPAARARLRDRFDVVLVDEFQDTDPEQWDVVRLGFAEAGATVVLIGDPKQAIYAFRGAEVHAYLAARHHAQTHATLGINWRSDQRLIDACGALWSGAQLGHPAIVAHPVTAAPGHEAPGLTGAPDDAALRMRIVRRADGHVPRYASGAVQQWHAVAHIAADLADDVVRVLRSGAVLADRGHGEGSRPVRPGDMAVLVRTNANAAVVRDALDDRGVPAVITGAASVFETPSAHAWLDLLRALERPSSLTRVRAAALGVLIGWNARRVAEADDAAWTQLSDQLHDWARVLSDRGMASLVTTLTRATGLPERILARRDGDRLLTDLRHIGQLLHAQHRSEGAGITALTTWLAQRIVGARDDARSDERSRRLESDAEAVQVLTVHRSKGLEFPIVYCPDLWVAQRIGDDEVWIHHGADGRRRIDVAGRRSTEARERHASEQRAEHLRLVYVALTRARHQAVVWWAGAALSKDAALTRLLFGDDDDGAVPDSLARVPDDDEVFGRVRRLDTAAAGAVSAAWTTAPATDRWTDEVARPPRLDVARVARPIDVTWRRASYSQITASAHHDRVASEPDPTAVDDEDPDVPAPDPAMTSTGDGTDEAALRAVPSLLAAMPGGAAVGTLVHQVLEHTDVTGDDRRARLAAAIAEEVRRSAVDVGDHDGLVTGLDAAVTTPLGPVVDDTTLADVALADRLVELEFELPLAGGDHPTGHVELSAVAALLREHLSPDDPFATYPDRLDDPAVADRLRGYLTGSIDVVLRLHGSDGTTRFAIIDLKTNRLGGEDLSAWHHRPTALAAAMQRAHHPLQALFYLVALHRYLRWRVAGYDPDHHIAGVAYAFLRGMSGPDTPRVDGQPCGVFAWVPPPGLVAGLSGLLDTGGPR